MPPAFEELVERWNRPGQPPAIADLPRVGDVLSAGQPIVSVFAEADTLAAVERTLEERAELVGICMANTQF